MGVFLLAQMIAWGSLEAAGPRSHDREVATGPEVEPHAVDSVTKYYEPSAKRPTSTAEEKRKAEKKKKKKKEHASKPSNGKSRAHHKTEKTSKGASSTERQTVGRKKAPTRKPGSHAVKTNRRKKIHAHGKKHRHTTKPSAAKRPAKRKKNRVHRKDKTRLAHGSESTTKIDKHKSDRKRKEHRKHLLGEFAEHFGRGGSDKESNDSGEEYITVRPPERKNDDDGTDSEFSILNSTEPTTTTKAQVHGEESGE